MSSLANVVERLRPSAPRDWPAPAPDVALEAAQGAVGPLPAELLELYRLANGPHCGAIHVLPLEDRGRMKDSWDGLGRANDPEKSKFVRDAAFLQRFLIFAEMEGMDFVAFERSSGAIWYSEAGQLHETSLSLKELLEQSVAESLPTGRRDDTRG